MFRPLSGDDQRTALGARNTSHLGVSLRAQPVSELRYVPGPLVKPGYDANELGVGRTTNGF
jgi:hypothetical protein